MGKTSCRTWETCGPETGSEVSQMSSSEELGTSGMNGAGNSVEIASASALLLGGAAAAIVAGSLVASDGSTQKVDETPEQQEKVEEIGESESSYELLSPTDDDTTENDDDIRDDSGEERHENDGRGSDDMSMSMSSTLPEEMVKGGDDVNAEGEEYESAMKGETIHLLRKPLIGNPLHVESLSHLLGVLDLVVKDPSYLEGLRDHALVISGDVSFLVIGDHFVAYDEEVYRKSLQTRLKTLAQTYHEAVMMKERVAAAEYLRALQELTVCCIFQLFHPSIHSFIHSILLRSLPDLFSSSNCDFVFMSSGILRFENCSWESG
jgi:hypothetical protein